MTASEVSELNRSPSCCRRRFLNVQRWIRPIRAVSENSARRGGCDIHRSISVGVSTGDLAAGEWWGTAGEPFTYHYPVGARLRFVP